MATKKDNAAACGRTLAVSLQLKTLWLCIAVADEGSLLRAANLWAIHPSALSRRISDLEYVLGARLFDRHPCGMRPTRQGRLFLRELRHIIRELDRIVSSFDS